MKLYEYHEIELTGDDFGSLPKQLKPLFALPKNQILIPTDETFDTTADFIVEAKKSDEYVGKSWVCFPEHFQPMHVKSKTQTIIEFGERK